MHPERENYIEQRVCAYAGERAGQTYAERLQASRAAETADELHVCLRCKGVLVHPLAWREEDDSHWLLRLRCPECESIREGVFEQTIVERLDDELDRGANALLGELQRVTHANMSEEAEFFVRALAADVIDPGDF
jgi:hypothetical protein